MPTKVEHPKRVWTAAELRSLSPKQRDSILRSAAALAEKEYKTNAELTAFDAFGEGDVDGESAGADSQSR